MRTRILGNLVLGFHFAFVVFPVLGGFLVLWKRKLHIFDRTQAVIYAIREGVIDVEELEYRPLREP